MMTTQTVTRSASPAPSALTDSAQAYPAMARILARLGESWADRPDLDALAAAEGWSPAQFQRTFRRWAGLPPGRVRAAYAHAAARRALDAGATVEEAADEAALSGPARLHDLTIAFEAVTPGAARARGKGLTFTWGVGPSPFGAAVLLISPRGLSALAFAPDGDEGEAVADLMGRFPAAAFARDDEEARRWLAGIFVEGAPVPLALYGTEWQRQVWRALLAIPPGTVTTYRSVAKTVCTPKASRAVGAAVGANPVSWLIPCHRVLASDARLTGYHWGVERKRAMLAFEDAWAGA